MGTTKSSCCKHKIIAVSKTNRAGGSMSFMSTLLLILLPKCPLCITAYMGAFLLFFDIDPTEMGPFLLHAKPALGCIIFFMIVFNNKGKKTLVAATIVISTMALLILSNYYYIDIVPNSVLYFTFFFAAWYNGNFEHFYKFVRRSPKKELG